jgi:2-polyprenyl-3-methyl-5-hydroxy-6-metoxy-1,4-benzoquinol methylase
MNLPSPVLLAYNALASEYDAQLAHNPVAVEMRAQIHAHLLQLFHAGDSVLDFTAGTGTDALFLAEHGVRVTALDISPAMLEQLKTRAARRGLPIDARVLTAEQLREVNLQGFDGALSTFAGLNTIENFRWLARDLAQAIRPGGRLLLHALNNFCFWEWAQHAARGQFRFARRTQLRVGAMFVPQRVVNPFALWRENFAPYFELRQVYAQSVLAAPSFAQRIRSRAGRAALFALDRAAGRLFPAWGDFFVAELERHSPAHSREQWQP